MRTARDSGGPAELRLALVCYGGVSLAIYMHGVTKELHKLVAASRACEQLERNPYRRDTDTEWAYFETLRALADAGRPVSVNVDIVAGTSAGGINGVCLAQALACNGSQDELKRVWIDEGDIKKLLIAGAKWRSILPGIGDDVFWSVVEAVRAPGPAGPLNGARMSRLLHAALGSMSRPTEEEPTTQLGSTLISPGQSLELYVTTSDLDGVATSVTTGVGGVSQSETDHHQVLRFATAYAGPRDFGPSAVGALAFAARATSSFPGAFPPVSISSFTAELRAEGVTDPVDADGIAIRMRHRYPGVDGTRRWFADGGLLDNAPFDLAAAAIAARPASSEVLRRLIYIQPDPGAPPGAAVQPSPPDYLDGLGKALLGVKGSHSILPELVRLREMNLRIAEIGTLAELQGDQIAEELTKIVGELTTLRTLDQVALGRAAAQVHGRVPDFVGAGYPGYCRLKVEAVAVDLAGRIAARLGMAPAGNGASFVQAALTEWARRHFLPDGTDGTTIADRIEQRFAPVDLLYRERRLQFLLAGINALYAPAGPADGPTRGELDELKAAAWSLLTDLRTGTAAAVAGLGDTTGFLADADDRAVPTDFVTDHDAEFAALFTAHAAGIKAHVASDTSALWQTFRTQTGDWDDRHRRALVARYLGFPLWDALLFPTLALSKLPQYTPIRVSQYSPLTATALGWKEPKLKGVAVHHFGAFLNRDWRCNDYLWGRLDGAELVLRTLLETMPADAQSGAGARLRCALSAVVESEARDGISVAGVKDAVDALAD